MDSATTPALCPCGCGAPVASRSLTWGRKGYATRRCYQVVSGRANGGKRRSSSKIEPYWHPSWKARVAEVTGVLRELGPLRTAALFTECRERFGWNETRFVNVLAAGHPGCVEAKGVWRALSASMKAKVA